MKLLTPLGLLGLLAIIALIIIYIIKPNYQQRRISSSFVWKLSLKYKKRRLPISKLRNIIIIICQILILTSCAIILAQPNKILNSQADRAEQIAIIASSASMRTKTDNDETRFERAINRALKDFGVLPQDGLMSVIIADSKPYFLLERINAEDKAGLSRVIDAFLEDEMSCSYGSADVDAAMALCENILKDNTVAQITLYSDTAYAYVPKNIKVVNVCDAEEWNAGILNAYAELEENNYAFYVDVACYGRDSRITVTLEVQNPNVVDITKEGSPIILQEIVECRQDVTMTVIFKHFKSAEEIPELDDDSQTVYCIIESQDRIYSYQSAHISLDGNDSFIEDDNFDIYGGQKEVIKVQYSSTLTNSFFNGILFVLQNAYRDRWDIQITEVKDGNHAYEGFDFYIFEHIFKPSTMPTDGVVFLVDPQSAPINSDIRISGINSFRRNLSLVEEEAHPILTRMIAENITVSSYVDISYYDPSYKVLMSCDTAPVLLVRDEDDAKVVIMAFSVHYSNIAILPEFPRLMYNMFEYFFPATVQRNAFEVYESISLKARSLQLKVTSENHFEQIFALFPAKMITEVPGTYFLEQFTFSGKKISEQIYVKIPAVESNIWKTEDSFATPYKEQDNSDYFKDLLLYIAATLVTVLFIEWWLYNREKL